MSSVDVWQKPLLPSTHVILKSEAIMNYNYTAPVPAWELHTCTGIHRQAYSGPEAVPRNHLR